MKYAIFGCLLFILGISAIQHESPLQKINKLNKHFSPCADFDLKWVNEKLVIDEVRDHQLPIQPGDIVIKFEGADRLDQNLDPSQNPDQIFISRKNAPEEILTLQRNIEGDWEDVTEREKDLRSYVDSSDR